MRNATPNGVGGRPTLLTPQVQKQIVALIRQGAFDWVAAQTAGISPKTFREWMARGEARDAERPPTNEFAAFAAQVRQARAAARSRAEITVRQDNPLAWLRYGPGRDKPDEPGWTESAQVSHAVSGQVVVVDMEEVKKKRWAQVAPALARVLAAGSGEAENAEASTPHEA